MADENTIQAPSEEATLGNSSDSTPATESSNVEASGEQISQEESKPTEEDLDRKYRESSKEARILKEEKEQLAKEYQGIQEDLLHTVTKDRPTFESYLDMKGFSPEDRAYYLDIYEKQIEANRKPTVPVNQATEPTQTQPTNTPIPRTQDPYTQPNPIRETWMSKIDQEFKKKFEVQKRAANEFMDAPENREVDQKALKAIFAQAEYLDEVKGLSPSEALSVARKQILDSDSYKDEGYVEGVQHSVIGGLNRGISTQGSKGSPFQLPKKDQAFADFYCQEHGLTGKAKEQYVREYATRLARDKQ